MPSANPPPPLIRLLRYAGTYRWPLRRAFAYSVLKKIFDLAPPLLIGAAVDVVVQREASFLSRFGLQDPWAQLVLLAVLTVIIWSLESTFDYVSEVAWRNLAQALQHDLRMDGYAHVQRLDLATLEDRSTGGLMAVLNDDINQLERFLDHGADDLIQVGTTVVVIGAIFFALEPTVAVFAFLPVPLVLWGSFWYQKRLEPRYAAVREQVGHLNHLLANNLGGIATIKSFTAEDDEQARLERESRAYEASNRGAIRFSAAFVPLIRMVIVAGFVMTLLLGGRAVFDGSLAVGAYSVMVFMTQRLLWPLTGLGQTVDLYQRAMASTNRILNLIDLPIHVRSGDRALAKEAVDGGIRFENVSFAYHPGHPVIEDLSLAVPARSTAALVGMTGSGKTTIVKLILRFYEPGGGAIRLDGVDLREIQLRDLRGAIGLVSQDVYLFPGTVRENIAYGDRHADDAAIRAAAEAAEAHRFIEALPRGYDTIVGERGQKLSGGQRQRISLARAVLKDPPILLLDEATSAVDNETEAAIQRSLAKLAHGRTILMIAHRLSTIRHADAIHVMENGRIAETGTHEELLARGGLYAGLWSVQTGETAKAELG